MATAATANNVVEAAVRDARGKNEARRVRKAGRVPATLYGAGKPPVSISVDPKQIAAILHSAAGHNTIFDLQLDGEVTKAMIVDWQREPIKGALLHLDLKRIAMDKRLTVQVPIVLTGEAAGVKQQGGILEQVLREIELECLPDDIPAAIEVDVTHLVSGQVLRVKDLPHGGKLHFLTEEELPVAHIVHVKEVAAAAPVEAGAEAAPAAAEPEVIKKGKQEAEETAAPAAEKAEKKEKK
ncbi:MAG: 50S ribosomal protein L25 [Terriglobales bacterium]